MVNHGDKNENGVLNTLNDESPCLNETNELPFQNCTSFEIENINANVNNFF